MKMQRMSFTAVFLCGLLMATFAGKSVAQCATASGGGGWVNAPFAAQTGNFTATFDATPALSNMNSVVGLSHGAGTAYTAFANLVAFNGTAGTILARDGATYASQTNVPYTGGSTYHFRLVVNVPAHSYSIFVTPPGGSELTIGSDFHFRTEQNTVTSLNNLGVFVGAAAGSLAVCNFAIGGTPPPPDFTLSATAASQTITAGGSTTYTVNVGAVNGFNGSVNFSVSGLPSGASNSFSPPSVSGAGSSVLSVSTVSTTAANSYSLVITGTSGAMTHSSSVTLNVNSAGVPDFILSAMPALQTVTAGNSTSYTVAVTPQNSFNGNVALSAMGLPTGASASFNPTSVTGSGSSTLNVTTSSSTPAATSTLTITGDSSSLSHATSVNLTVHSPTTGTDWSVAVVDSTMKRFTPATIGGWSYPVGLYLHGQYLVFKRTRNPSYLQFIQAWADRFVDSSGNINNGFSSLDSMQPIVVLLDLFQETGLAKYRIAAGHMRARLNTYPRTSDGGFWHATSRQHQLWGDGTFMVLPGLIRYGQLANDSVYANNEVGSQLEIYASHLQDTSTGTISSGLLFHAFDESRTQSWADKTTGRSPEVWCRAMGWYSMATIEALEILPANDPHRPQLIAILQKIISGIAKWQDPATGRWFQVVDKPSVAGNFTETSSSSMYTYVISRAVERGYVDPSFLSVAQKGYQGVLQRISLDGSGMTNLTQICIGTNVGNLAFYLARPRATNDFHGLGAFLIMNEQLTK